MIFKERLPPLWWAGAAMLVIGTVVIGRREEEDVVVVQEADGMMEEGCGMVNIPNVFDIGCESRTMDL